MNDTLQTGTGKLLIALIRRDSTCAHCMKNLSHILLDKLGRRARAGGHTIDVVGRALPAALVETLVFARLDGDTLILTVTSPGAATRMRFCQRDIINACNGADMRPRTVKFKVSPHPTDANQPTGRQSTPAEAPQLSKAAAEQLDSLASDVTCEALQAALTRLATRGKRR